MNTLDSPDSIIENVKSNLTNYKVPEEIVALYLYGSILRGKLRSESDIDAAFLPHYKLSEAEALGLISIIEHIFTKIFKCFGIQNEVSVLNMRNKYVSMELLFYIIQIGVCIYEKSQDEHFEFKNFITGEYFDFKPFIHRLRKEKYGFV